MSVDLNRVPGGGRQRMGCLLVLVALLSALGQTSADEYSLKRAFLYHIAQFTDWPEDTFAPGDTLLFCTVGSDPFAGGLERFVAGKTIGGHALRVLHMRHGGQVQGCHIAFVSHANRQELAELLATANHAPILTVGEFDGFVQNGGALGFIVQGNKIRFDINLDAVHAARLKIGSRLLLLARSVRGQPAAP